jgi:hypothetical protein
MKPVGWLDSCPAAAAAAASPLSSCVTVYFLLLLFSMRICKESRLQVNMKQILEGLNLQFQMKSLLFLGLLTTEAHKYYHPKQLKQPNCQLARLVTTNPQSNITSYKRHHTWELGYENKNFIISVF